MGGFDIRAALGEYETKLGQRTGRLAITIDRGASGRLGLTATCMKWYVVGLTFFLFVRMQN